MYWFQRWFEKITEAIRSESRMIQEAVQSQVETIRVDRESAHREQSASAEIIARAINTASDATSGYEKSQRDKEYRLQGFLVFLTFLAAGGALAAAVGSFIYARIAKDQVGQMIAAGHQTDYQLCLYRQQLAEMRRESESWQTMANASAVQANAMARIESAYILMNSANEPQIVDGKPPSISFHVFNDGHTAARQLHIHMRFELVPKGNDPSFIYPKKQSIEEFWPVLPPQAGNRLPWETTTRRAYVLKEDGTPVTVDREFDEQWRKRQVALVLYSSANYWDVFGVEHFGYWCTGFSYSEEFGRTLSEMDNDTKCVDYNREDTNAVVQQPSRRPTHSATIPVEPPCVLPKSTE